MKDRSDDPSHNEQTLLPRSYILLLLEYGDMISMSRASYFSDLGHQIEERKEIVLSENTINTFYLQLYGIWH